MVARRVFLVGTPSCGQTTPVGLHAVAVFTVDTAAVWVCRHRPVQRNLVVVTGRFTERNGDPKAV